jgi:predicted phosphodiesterase
VAVKRAIVSDIHANLEALEAVLADLAHEGVDSIYCLGDIVGYGPNPRECIDRVISFDQSILGNHDQGALYDPEGFPAAPSGPFSGPATSSRCPMGTPSR